MDVRISAGHYQDKGNAVKITCYANGKIDVEPVYYEKNRFKIIILTPFTGAVIEVGPDNVAAVHEMLEYHEVPNHVVVAASFWDKGVDVNAPIMERSRSLTQSEHNKGIRSIHYTGMRDGAYDEQVHRHRIANPRTV
jgi:hypothetical protein